MMQQLIDISSYNNKSPSAPGKYHKIEDDTKYENIRVVARFRPPNKIETQYSIKNIDVLNDFPIFEGEKYVSLEESGNIAKNINSKYIKIMLDRMYNYNISQKELFYDIGLPIINAALQGNNTCILAYGQTGSGKTFTVKKHDQFVQMCMYNICTIECFFGFSCSICIHFFLTDVWPSIFSQPAKFWSSSQMHNIPFPIIGKAFITQFFILCPARISHNYGNGTDLQKYNLGFVEF